MHQDTGSSILTSDSHLVGQRHEKLSAARRRARPRPRVSRRRRARSTAPPPSAAPSPPPRRTRTCCSAVGRGDLPAQCTASRPAARARQHVRRDPPLVLMLRPLPAPRRARRPRLAGRHELGLEIAERRTSVLRASRLRGALLATYWLIDFHGVPTPPMRSTVFSSDNCDDDYGGGANANAAAPTRTRRRTRRPGWDALAASVLARAWRRAVVALRSVECGDGAARVRHAGSRRRST